MLWIFLSSKYSFRQFVSGYFEIDFPRRRKLSQENNLKSIDQIKT